MLGSLGPTLVVVAATVLAVVVGTVLVLRILPVSVKNRVVYVWGTVLLRMGMALHEKSVFCIDYGGGFNLHFECTHDELRRAIPNPNLTPIPMRIVDGDDLDKEPRYLVSVYAANTNNPQDGDTSVHLQDTGDKIGNRADVFTYVRDKSGKTGLVFLSAMVRYPQDPNGKAFLETLMHFFGMDPTNYQVGYPHHSAEFISLLPQQFHLKFKSAEIKIGNANTTTQDDDDDKIKKNPTAKDPNVLATDARLHRDFCNANSQIYRGPNGARNVNFFNQDFMDASVTCWDPQKAVATNTTDIHPLCRKLVAVQSYRDPQTMIRWYFENS